jgi:hypothetical protein
MVDNDKTDLIKSDDIQQRWYKRKRWHKGKVLKQRWLKQRWHDVIEQRWNHSR